MTGIVVVGARGGIGDTQRAIAAADRARRDTACEVVQLLDARAVFSAEHLVVATEHALRAFAERRNVSQALGVEIVRYASGERQIADAMTRLGLRADTDRVGIVAVGPRAEEAAALVCGALGLEPDDRVLAGGREALEALGFSSVELRIVPEEAWSDLVLERVALVEVERR